jgi:hypothetical protein
MPKSTTMAFHLRGTRVKSVAPVRGARAGAKPLPRKLVIPAGTYRFKGETYDLRKEGLYRWHEPCKANRQRIVFHKDVLALVSGLCWIHSHGTRDEAKSFSAQCRHALTDKLILTCGPFSNFVSQLFDRLGIRHRVVSMRTLETPNGWNDGHVTMEVLLGRKWTLLDLDPHAAYRYKGRRLSLLDMVPRVRAGDYEVERLAASYSLAIANFRDPKTGYDYGMLVETRGWGDSRIEIQRQVYRRVLGIPCIADGGSLYFTAINEAERRKAMRQLKTTPRWQGLVYLPPAEFRAKFYRP